MKITASSIKKLAISAILASAGSVSMLSHAAVTLLVDDHIKVTAINGQELKQSMFQPLTKQFTLQPGQHVITAKYDRLYNLPRDEHDYLRSGNISVAANLADNQTYRLTMPNQPEKYEAAKEYAERPTLAVQQGNAIVASQESIAGDDGGIFSGLGKALGGVFGGGGDAEVQNQRAIAALGQAPAGQSTVTQGNVNSGAVSSTTYTAIPRTNAAQSANTLDSFMQLWLQATPAEREKIRQWIQQ
ncbi:DUF2057 family protein [Psychrobacter jeotgali]|uniref:DUF2057 family protein n=1 Tax=Psychrobacter jeotgali TaxID=179010 RepID=UPI00191A7132|nr:DUF2057 family protein [Psychrobacter jeotgali]